MPALRGRIDLATVTKKQLRVYINNWWKLGYLIMKWFRNSSVSLSDSSFYQFENWELSSKITKIWNVNIYMLCYRLCNLILIVCTSFIRINVMHLGIFPTTSLQMALHERPCSRLSHSQYVRKRYEYWIE